MAIAGIGNQGSLGLYANAGGASVKHTAAGSSYRSTASAITLHYTDSVNGDRVYDETNICTKYDFKRMVLELMQVQYDNGNLAAYQTYKQFYDTMSAASDASWTAADEEYDDYQQFLSDYMQRLFVKLENGDAEQSYQIGASSFTEKEWEEFLENFDSAEEALKELAREEQTRAREQREAALLAQENETISAVALDMLTSQTVQARYWTQETDENGNPLEDVYLIAMDSSGIRCCKPGADTYEWEIAFTDETQYQMAAELLNHARATMDNFLFAAHKNFWEDYLSGSLDAEAFQQFLVGTANGIPDYSLTVDDSVYIDEEKAQWAQYMNPFGASFYTAEEMVQMQEKSDEGNALAKLTDPYSITYRLLHPEYSGERIFCEYPGGTLYTADEIMEIMNQNWADADYQARARL